MSERRTELPEKAISLLDREIKRAFEVQGLIKEYGPADRYGTTEWMARAPRVPLPGASYSGPAVPVDEVRVYISMAAWPNDENDESSATIQSSAAVRTSQWVARKNFTEYRVLVNGGPDVHSKVDWAVYEAYVSKFLFITVGDALTWRVSTAR
jgi:hypothetical protein